MKKLLLLAATAAMVLSSCSNDEPIGVNPEQGDAIDFRAFADKGTGTRTTITTTNNILGFTVTGVWNGGQEPYLFNAVDINRREGGIANWTYDPVRYWPKKGTGIDFYAYSPASSIYATGLYNYVAGGPITYTVPDPKKDNGQEDFLLARTDPMGYNNGTVINTSAVQMNFVHALSRVKFYARTTKPEINYTISEIALVKIEKSGTIDMADVPTDGVLTYDDTPTGTVLTNWTPAGSLSDVKVDLSEAPAYLDDTFRSLTGETNSLMVLPQTTSLPTATDSPVATVEQDKFYIKVSYRAFDLDGFYYAGSPATPKTVYFRVVDPIRTTSETAFTFEMGRQYNIQLTFGTDAGEPIKFAVDVSLWTDNPQFVYVPDLASQIDSKILQAAGLTAANVTLAAVEAIPSLTISMTAASPSLAGIGYFTGLTSLTLTSTVSSDVFDYIDLSKNTSLATLTLDGVTANASTPQEVTSTFGQIILPQSGVTSLTINGTAGVVEKLIVWDGYATGDITLGADITVKTAAKADGTLVTL